jgi:hypothetical protein
MLNEKRKYYFTYFLLLSEPLEGLFRLAYRACLTYVVPASAGTT